MKFDNTKIIEYDFDAPRKYQIIKSFIINNISVPNLDVQHIGSSSVKGLGGKRVIDVQITTNKSKMFDVVEQLKSFGYNFIAEKGAGIFDQRYFISGNYKDKNTKFHVHYHITFKESKNCIDTLKFRDYLRKNKKEADNYYKLKKQWMDHSQNDLISYTELKTPYIRRIVQKKGR